LASVHSRIPDCLPRTSNSPTKSITGRAIERARGGRSRQRAHAERGVQAANTRLAKIEDVNGEDHDDDVDDADGDEVRHEESDEQSNGAVYRDPAEPRNDFADRVSRVGRRRRR
jgi:hypothetical protein